MPIVTMIGRLSDIIASPMSAKISEWTGLPPIVNDLRTSSERIGGEGRHGRPAIKRQEHENTQQHFFGLSTRKVIASGLRAATVLGSITEPSGVTNALVRGAPNHGEAALDHAGATFKWKYYRIKAAVPSGDQCAREDPFVCLPDVSAIVAYCFVALCLARSPSARRIGRTVRGIEDHIETRCSFVHGRSPASSKAGNYVKPRRAIVRDQVPASRI